MPYPSDPGSGECLGDALRAAGYPLDDRDLLEMGVTYLQARQMLNEAEEEDARERWGI